MWRINPIYAAGWTVCRLGFALYFRARYFHPERVPRTGPVILAANHLSYLDPPLVGAGVRRPLSFLARENLFARPVLGWLLLQWDVVPVDREGGGAAGLKGVLDRLRAGKGVVLFPEGTRSPDGQMRRARSGIGLVILKSGAPVVPARVFGTFEAYRRHARIPRPHRVMVKYGPPLSFAAWKAEAKACSKKRLKEIYQAVADELMSEIRRLEPCVDQGASA